MVKELSWRWRQRFHSWLNREENKEIRQADFAKRVLLKTTPCLSLYDQLFSTVAGRSLSRCALPCASFAEVIPPRNASHRPLAFQILPDLVSEIDRQLTFDSQTKSTLTDCSESVFDLN